METATFRKWLAERGCRFDPHQHHSRPHGHGATTIHREGRTATLPMVGTMEQLDPRLVRQICEELGLDFSELPGPKSRV